MDFISRAMLLVPEIDTFRFFIAPILMYIVMSSRGSKELSSRRDFFYLNPSQKLRRILYLTKIPPQGNIALASLVCQWITLVGLVLSLISLAGIIIFDRYHLIYGISAIVSVFFMVTWFLVCMLIIVYSIIICHFFVR